MNGNVVADPALTMYIDFSTIHGNVISNGGGDITMVDPNGLVLPIRDNVVDGNIVVHGWEGAWFGIIRNYVGGSVIAGTRSESAPGSDAPGGRLGYGRQASVCGAAEPPTRFPWTMVTGPIEESPCVQLRCLPASA